ncbi:MAG: translocation/assembly module TamB domain-containing protein [Verrucomicrobia bacterium]|nr:translocation/assembly module TamB domain-containing protein [Verrucomicrobiota bacterium]OQC66242.1 MAG: hypothetical protein BWX48_01778 [Verrucomicrobia bacterium ADurb.Bin006]MDI9381129.1 translocation/assembly module TamB domain-containing protein [Verrucomicrobiota bacterium]NMD22522.1 hypothetical protein [Verrucomicrobiota bacterium]HNU98887.1 translocation/assembly module TamB domain-containing protein [Verrucomicrobiota bacterium]
MNRPAAKLTTSQRVVRTLRVLGAAAAATLVAVALLPFWLPPALKLGLPRLGVQAGAIDRIGYATLQLQEVHFQSDTMDITLRDMRLPQPIAWAWRRWLNPAPDTNAIIRLTGCVVLPKRADPSEKRGGKLPARLSGMLDAANELIPGLRKWLPPLDLNEGRIVLSEHEILVPELRWRAGELKATAEIGQLGINTRISIAAHAPGRLSFRLQDLSRQVELKAELHAGESEWGLTGVGFWLDNVVHLRAKHGRNSKGLWPDRVELEAPQVKLSGRVLGVPGCSNVLGQVRLFGTEGRFELRVSGRTEPASVDLPPGRLNIEALVNPTEISVTGFEARIGTIDAVLSNPVTWRWASRQIDRPARLTLQADLDAQSWIDMGGRIQGDVLLTLGEGLEPRAEFEFAGKALTSRWIDVSTLELSGRTSGRLIERCAVSARWENGSELRVVGRGLDPAGRTLSDAQLEAVIEPGLPFLGKWPLTFQSATARATVSGAWTNLQHRGTVTVSGGSVRGLKTFDLTGRWEGDRAERIWSSVILTTDGGKAAFSGTIEDLSNLTLSALSLRALDEPPLVLREPARLKILAPAAPLPGPRWSVQTSPLTLADGRRQIALEGLIEWPARAQATLAVTNLNTRFLDAFLARRLPMAALESLAVEVSGGRGPAMLTVAASGWWQAAPDFPIRMNARFKGDDSGLQIAEFRMFEGEAEALRIEGGIPLVCGFLETGRLWHLSSGRGLELDFSLALTPTIEMLGLERLGFAAANLRCEGSVSGTPAAPVGEMRLRASNLLTLTSSPLAGWLPRIDDVDLILRADADHVRLDSARLEVEGAPLDVSIALPVSRDFWVAALRGAFEADPANLSGSARLDALPLARLASRFVPELRPEGTLSADVQLLAGWRWSGNLEFGGFGTRPLPFIGPLRDLHGRMVLRDRRARLEGVAADVGGTTAQIEGWFDLPAVSGIEWRTPAFDIRLGGTQLALVRQADLIVRGDLDLRLQHGQTDAPSLAGTVVLGRSFVLSDLEAVLGNRLRAPERPPPFFSVVQEPFAGWRLDVDIQGDECIHARSPFYTGVHSVHLKLRGTLRDPVLLGDARVVRGNLTFPYATLPVRQGLVTFTETDPTRPRVQASAGARAFGYDLILDASGTLTDPVIRFSSSPPLSSEDILLMITVGELPRQQMDATAADRLSKLAILLGKDLMNKLGKPGSGEGQIIYRAGERVSARGKVTRHLEYRLTDTWSLVAEYDEFDELSAGVKWRVLRR